MNTGQLFLLSAFVLNTLPKLRSIYSLLSILFTPREKNPRCDQYKIKGECGGMLCSTFVYGLLHDLSSLMCRHISFSVGNNFVCCQIKSKAVT